MNALRIRTVAACICIACLNPALAGPSSKQDDKDKGREVEAAPLPGATDSRLATFTYNPTQIYRVLTAANRHTHIQLEPDEYLVDEPVLGDSQPWEVAHNGPNIYLKPHFESQITSLTLVSNKRTYQLTLISGPAGGHHYQQVRWRFPEVMGRKTEAAKRAESERQEVKQQEVASLRIVNRGYSIEGDDAIKPSLVFDDGSFVWLLMPEGVAWPAPYLKEGSEETVLDFQRERPSFLVIKRLLGNKTLVLRSGEMTVTIRGPGAKGTQRAAGAFARTRGGDIQ